jgi:membrane protein DedA with SNARE-associated domain
MEQFFHIVIEYIAQGGYFAILIGMALESACIPIPSELILGFAGYLVYLERMEFIPAVMAGVAGGLIGSVAAYLIGYYGGRPLVMRYGRYILLSERNVEIAQRWFDRYGLTAALYSRLLPVIRTFISLPAGFAKVNFEKFAVYTVLGSIPWTVALIYVGLLLGENWQLINNLGHKISFAVAAAFIIAIIYYYRKNHVQPDTDKV